MCVIEVCVGSGGIGSIPHLTGACLVVVGLIYGACSLRGIFFPHGS